MIDHYSRPLTGGTSDAQACRSHIFHRRNCVPWFNFRANQAAIFNIGSKNGLHTEFAQNREAGHAVLYKVGESSTEKDWPAYQPGSFDSIVGRSTMQHDWTEVHPDPLPEPYKVQFSLAASPKGTFTLHLDAIFRYRRPAPPLYRVVINGNFAASYRLNPHPAPELWWPNGGDAQGNMQYFGYESLDMQLPASAFTNGGEHHHAAMSRRLRYLLRRSFAFK